MGSCHHAQYLQRNHVEPPRQVLAQMKCMQTDAMVAESFDVLLGIEGNAAREYFQNFAGIAGLGLMEPFRPLIADSAVLSAINTRMLTERDFIRTAGAVALTPNGRNAFFRAYEQRMDTLVTHPLFGPGKGSGTSFRLARPSAKKAGWPKIVPDPALLLAARPPTDSPTHRSPTTDHLFPPCTRREAHEHL